MGDDGFIDYTKPIFDDQGFRLCIVKVELQDGQSVTIPDTVENKTLCMYIEEGTSFALGYWASNNRTLDYAWFDSWGNMHDVNSANVGGEYPTGPITNEDKSMIDADKNPLWGLM